MAEAVCFHSPVADYEGRAEVAHLLWLIASVVREVEPTRELVDGTARTSFITGVVDGQPVQGVLDEHYDQQGLLTAATLMLRPFAALRVAIAAMAAALEADPLPGAR